MNTQTGEVKNAADLTEAEKKSGLWTEFFTDKLGRRIVFFKKKPPSKSEQRREKYMEGVKAKKFLGENF